MKNDRKLTLTLSAALLSSIVLAAGCSREIAPASADGEAARAASEAARSAAEATGAARSAVDDLVDANHALQLRVQELESRLARSDGREFEPSSASGYEPQPSQQAQPSHRAQPSAPAYETEPATDSSRSVGAQYEGYAPEPSSRSDYRYDGQRYPATPVLADTRAADWSTPSRFRDVPQPYRPPQADDTARREPTWRRSTIEEGTPIKVEIVTPISTRDSRPGDSFTARLASDLLASNGRVAIPEGAEIRGHVADMRKSQRIGGRPSLTLAMDRIELPDGSSAPIEASWETRGKSQTQRDAATIGGATVGGAILGRILDHDDGGALGALIGAGAGTAIAHQKVGQPIALGAGAVLNMHLRAPIEVRVRD